jgi:flagellar hook-associated protein FlgK
MPPLETLLTYASIASALAGAVAVFITLALKWKTQPPDGARLKNMEDDILKSMEGLVSSIDNLRTQAREMSGTTIHSLSQMISQLDSTISELERLNSSIEKIPETLERKPFLDRLVVFNNTIAASLL